MYEQISKLVEHLENSKRASILLVGDYMLDEYLIGDIERISPEAPVPVMRVVSRVHRLGGAGSVAASMSGLEAKTYCVGLVGNDKSGKIIKNLLEKSQIDITGLLENENITTTVKQRMIGMAQHRIRQQLLRVDEEKREKCCGRTLELLKNAVLQHIDNVDLIAIEDYDKGVFVDNDFAQWIIEQAKKRNIAVIVDPANIANYSRYENADYITPNRLEASNASGIKICSIEDAKHSAEILIDKYGIKYIAITLDRDGLLIADSDNKEFRHIPTQARDVYDNTGAGDVVLASLSVGLSEGLDIYSAAILANVAGGWEVQQSGAVPITRNQLKFELLVQHRRHQGKLIDRKNLVRELDILRSAGKKIVFTNGCFDLLHPGHVSYLEFAREQGDLLVVGMNSDSSVKKLKGPNRPLINEKERARMLAALQAVDYVVIFDEPSVIHLVKEIKPDVLVKGQDYNVEGVVGHEFVQSYGGRIALAPIEHEYSTTKIINTIIERANIEKSNEKSANAESPNAKSPNAKSSNNDSPNAKS